MQDIVHYSHCPVCSSAELQPVFRVKDYTVSGELFAIVECKSCTLRFTQDVPAAASIGPYYKSENYISHTNTAKGLVNRLYHFVRKRTLGKKRRLIQKATGLGKGTLLDIGAGTGAFVNEMNQHGWWVTGLEPDNEARAVAKKDYNAELQDISQLYQLEANSFDAITLWHVLEHVHDLQNGVKQLKNLLKPDGKIFIAVPNYTSRDAAIYKEYWAAYDVPRHLYHFSPASMEKLVRLHGMKIRNYQPMWYDSFYVSMLSNKYKTGNTQMIKACWNGLRSNLKAWGDKRKCSSVIYIIEKDH